MADEKNDFGIGSLFDKIYTKFFLRDLSYIVSGFAISYLPLKHLDVFPETITLWAAVLLAVSWLVIAFIFQEILVLVGVLRMQPWRSWFGRPTDYVKQEIAGLKPNFWPQNIENNLEAAQLADTTKANYERVVQLKSFAATVATSIFFAYPCLMYWGDDLSGPLRPQGFWIFIALLWLSFVGALWANARKTDVQFALAGWDTATNKDPHQMARSAWAVLFTIGWFGSWTSLAVWQGWIPSPFDLAATPVV